MDCTRISHFTLIKVFFVFSPPGPTTEENPTGSTTENSAVHVQYGEISLIVLGAYLLSKIAA